MTGRTWKLGDNISTDLLAPGKYAHLRTKPKEHAVHTLETVRPEFAGSVRDGDFVVAGKNFGRGSSREIAVHVLKELGVEAVIAKSCARIYFRNAINTGLLVITGVDTDQIEDGDILELDRARGVLYNRTKGTQFSFPPLPEFLGLLAAEGGLVEYVKRHGTLPQ